MTISYTDFELDILKYEFTIRSGNRTVAALVPLHLTALEE